MNYIWPIVALPALAGLAALALPWARARRALLPTTALAHAACVVRVWMVRPAPAAGGWLALDALGLLFLAIVSLLFLAASVYATGYLERESLTQHRDSEEGLFFVNQPERVFVCCLLLFLATMSLVCVSRHLGLIWVAIEATTLSSAPLIYFHRHHRSLEAAWKYLLICSVGIALALLGNFFLAIAASGAGTAAGEPSLLLADLARLAPRMQPVWLKAAFVFLLVGYGTKMGLAPMHNWLPDAHSEAPSAVSALLSGALLNCAFLGVLRAEGLCAAAGQTEFAHDLLLVLGAVSVAVAAVFILGQRDFKRMLAYSSVEHMGLLAIGVGLGGAAVVGGLLHAVNHSLTKASLFLAAGNIMTFYRTKSCTEVRGLIRARPLSGALWLAGFLAITGTPPFGVFVSKFAILRGAFGQGHAPLGVLLLILLAIIFIGMCAIVLRMTQGTPEPGRDPGHGPEPAWSVGPPLALAAAGLTLGFYLPAPLVSLLREAAALMGGG
ncbi:MAG: proton-conducting transporter membrane subunit [Kiritimatiellae bacterium]|nr:proton-conducting transporter membrane subunit [Kiritimatiellia bacterium]